MARTVSWRCRIDRPRRICAYLVRTTWTKLCGKSIKSTKSLLLLLLLLFRRARTGGDDPIGPSTPSLKWLSSLMLARRSIAASDDKNRQQMATCFIFTVFFVGLVVVVVVVVMMLMMLILMMIDGVVCGVYVAVMVSSGSTDGSEQAFV